MDDEPINIIELVDIIFSWQMKKFKKKIKYIYNEYIYMQKKNIEWTWNLTKKKHHQHLNINNAIQSIKLYREGKESVINHISFNGKTLRKKI